jgi:hypothetical protein
MSTVLTQQTIVFIMDASSTNVPLNDILSDTGIVSLGQSSTGQDVVYQVKTFFNYVTGTYVGSTALFLDFIVTAAVALQVIAGISALKARIQALDPQVIDVVTWGTTIAFG